MKNCRKKIKSILNTFQKYKADLNRSADSDNFEKDNNKKKELPKTQAINGEIACFDTVISTEYPYFAGEVNAVDKVGSPEHDGKSENDYVFVDFQSDKYSASRIKEIEKYFSDLYGEPKTFDKLIKEADLFNMKTSPDKLIRVTESELKMLLKNQKTAESFCNKIINSAQNIKPEKSFLNELKEKQKDVKPPISSKEKKNNKIEIGDD